MRLLDSLSCRAQLFRRRQGLPSLLLVRVFLQPFGLLQMRPCLKRVVPAVSPLNTPKMAVSIITLNTNGIRGSDKQLRLLQWLQALSVVPDIVCLQEVHCVSDVECQSWFRSSGYLSVVSPGSNKSCGCIILYRPVLSFVKSWSDDDGRFLQCEFVYCGRSFRVVSLYAPNRNPARHDFFEQVPSLVDPSIPTVVCGDFNAVFNRSLGRLGSDTTDISRESSIALSHLFELCCCTDIWCYLHPSSSCFTWTSSDGTLVSCIDFVGCPYVWALCLVL